MPAGPRCEWAVDLITNLGPASGPKRHVLSAICCFSKFCVLTVLEDRTSTTVATALRQHVFNVFGHPAVLRSDNGPEFRGAVDALCDTYSVKHRRTAPYTSHSNGVVERLHRTVEDLLRRCLITLDAAHWPTLLPDLQLTINTTYQRSIGCPPYLLMFGAPPPSAAHAQLPDPTTTTTQLYAAAVRRHVATLAAAATAANTTYRRRSAVLLPPDPMHQRLAPGKLAMVVRPRHNKILTANAGPFLVLRCEPPHVHLQSLTHAVTLKENVKNVVPFNLDLPPTPPV